MANTEGIPDEHIASLLSLSIAPPVVKSVKTSSSKRKNRLAKRDTALKLQQQKEIQNPQHFDQIGVTINDHSNSTHDSSRSSTLRSQRLNTTKKSRFRFQRESMMELTDGMKPSARVIRPSKPESPAKITPITASNQENKVALNESETCHSSKQSSSNQRPPIMLSESIFERNVSSRNMQQINFNSKPHMSRCKERKLLSNHNQGFPSLDLPVGTFIPNKKKTIYSNKDSNTSRTVRLPDSQSQPQSLMKDNFDKDDASKHILSQMSTEQIKEEIAELKSTLSPDLIDFLRQRGKKKENRDLIGDSNNNHKMSQSLEASPSSLNLENSIEEVNTLEDSDKQRNKKEEIARILSSISTMKDLDEAVLQQQQHQDLNGENTNILDCDSNETKPTQRNEKIQSASDIETCTSLLRSTSSHQRLLAAKTVSKCLQIDLNEYINSLSNQNYNFNFTECQSRVSYPSLLPVALRCLLDLPSPHKHMVLHGHVLQSLYSLLLLHSGPENCFIYDIQRKTLSKPSNPFPKSVSRENEIIQLNIDHPSLVYQYFFLEDNIPTLPPTSSYTSSSGKNDDENDSNGNNFLSETGFYAIDTSAKAASLDGIAFYNDPMWTMLSRMKIIPCIANLLHFCHGRHRKHSESLFDEKTNDEGMVGTNINSNKVMESRDFISLKEESWISICGILTLLSLRSPGAACAIAQHKSILNDIIDGTLSMSTEDQYDHSDDSDQQKNYSGFAVNTKVALPTLILLCTLARQSRAAACAPPFANIMNTIHAILGMEAENNEEYTVQFYSIILWRILLRYGLAIPHLSTFLSISTRHFSATRVKNQSSQYLAAEYLTSFTNICECAAILTRSSAQQKHKTKSHKSTKLTTQQRETLSMSGGWLGSYAQECASLIKDEIQFDTLTAHDIKDISARSMFLASYIKAVAPTPLSEILIDERNEEKILEIEKGVDIHEVLSKGTFHANLSMKNCIESFASFVDKNDGKKLLNFALDTVLRNAFVLNWEEIIETNDSLAVEASCASLIKACASFLWSMRTAEFLDDEQCLNSRDLLDDIMIKFANLVFEALIRQSSIQTRADQSSKVNAQKIQVALARKGWLNSAHSFLAKFLGFFIRHKMITKKNDSSVEKFDDMGYGIIRSFNYCLLGRLQPGEESLAAMILSEDLTSPILRTLDVNEENIIFPSVLSKAILRALCSSKLSRDQFLHSAKVCRSIGFIGSIYDTFSLQSLRYHVDQIFHPQEANTNDSVSTLPLGEKWIWHILSSTITPIDSLNLNESESSSMDNYNTRNLEILNDTKAILSTCLGILNTMENEDEIIRSLYVNRINIGFKLYHLTNICLFPEEILRDDTLQKLFVSIFEKLSNDNSSSFNKIESFVGACFQHSRVLQKQNDNPLDASKSKETKAQEEIIYGDSKQFSTFSNQQTMCINDYMNDVMDIFLQYGAQYDLFMYCIRFFLHPAFPVSARKITLTKLKDASNFLTVETEDLESKKKSLKHVLNGGLPSRDGSRRDPPELLDSFSSILMKERVNLSSRTDYLYLVSVAYLGRNLSSSLQRCECGVEASKRRLGELNKNILLDILMTAKTLLKSSVGDRDDLVNIVFSTCYSSENDLTLDNIISSGIQNENNWKRVVDWMIE